MRRMLRYFAVRRRNRRGNPGRRETPIFRHMSIYLTGNRMYLESGFIFTEATTGLEAGTSA